MERPMIPKHSIRYFERFCQLPPELRIKIYMFMVEPRVCSLNDIVLGWSYHLTANVRS
ncbi:hypothetical protein B0O99DRAFT_617222 [Bisporella sp. PMI_857]|nr:hypothetical protein B0O99DRAFT_617222 [Bisporella sp. PMI_857]